MGGVVKYATLLLTLFSFFDSQQSLKHKLIGCSKLGYEICKCVFPDGQGLDLSLPPQTSFGWVESRSQSNHSIYFNPCSSPFDNTTNPCFKSLVCLNINETININLGKSRDAILVMESISRTPYLEFKVPFTSLVTTIELLCEPSLAKPELDFLSDNGQHYFLRMRGSECCLKRSVTANRGGGGGGGDRNGGGLGTFSVLLIVATVLLIVYFVGGYLVLRFIKGARGVETVPNHEFWLHLPTHCKNGMLFLFNGCKSPVTYETI